ncbi:MAG: UPF0182 family protein [Candidatus Ranarchaeia archaeon]
MKATNWLVLVLVFSGIILGGSLWFSLFFLEIRINDAMYLAKAGVSFWRVWSLDNQVFTASILLTVCSMITFWPRSSLYQLYSSFARRMGLIPLGKRVIPLWRILQFLSLFGFYVLNGGYSISGVNVAFLLFLSVTGAITISPNQLGTLVNLIFTPYSSTDLVISLIPAMEALNFYFGLISTFLIFTVIRLVISGIADFIGEFKIIDMIMKICISLSIITIGGLFTIPSWVVNVGTYLSFTQIMVGSSIFLVPLIYLTYWKFKSTGSYRSTRSNQLTQLKKNISNLESKIKTLQEKTDRTKKQTESLVNYYQKRREAAYEMHQIKNRVYEYPEELPVGELTILAIPLVIIFLSTPLFHYFTYGIGMDGAQYTPWLYNTQINKELEISQWVVNNDVIKNSTIDNFINQIDVNDTFVPSDVTSVRQWDGPHAYTKMRNQIGVNWMTLADSDIIFWEDHEYWMAPLSLNTEVTTSDFISQHFLYTHAEGLIAINAYTGSILDSVEFESIFGVESDYPLYYSDGYDPYVEVYVDYPGFEETGEHDYAGEPDYVIAGLESFVWFLLRGQFSFMGQSLDMLIQRDVRHRVQSILLQGLTTEVTSGNSDVYPVFSPDGDLLFAVPIYTNYQLTTGYAHYPYYRYLGLATVDVSTGELEFYKNPTVNENSTFLEKTYYDFYNWQDMPNWLSVQHRYPEDLWENQLYIDFYYHVDTPEEWRNNEDVFHRPLGTDVNYLIMNLNGSNRYVGAQIVEFASAQGQNLAGLYLVNVGSSDFGEMTFYRAGGSGVNALLGPTAAQQALTSDTQVAQFLELLGNHEIGNIYLYQIQGNLLYVLPIYKDIGGSGATITKLSGVGLVEATTGESVSLGIDILEAYVNLFGIGNQTTTGLNVSLNTLAFNPLSITNGSETDLLIQTTNNDPTFHNVSLNIVTYSDNINVSYHGVELSPTVYASNYTFSTNTWELGPSDFFGTTFEISATLDSGSVLQQYYVTVQLIVDDEIMGTEQIYLTVTQT